MCMAVTSTIVGSENELEPLVLQRWLQWALPNVSTSNTLARAMLCLGAGGTPSLWPTVFPFFLCREMGVLKAKGH